MASFVSIEKELIQFYSEAMDNIKVVEQKEADEGMSQFRSKSEEASQEQFKLQSTKTTIQTPAVITPAASLQRSSAGDSSSPPKQVQPTTTAPALVDPSGLMYATAPVSSTNPSSGMSDTPVGAPTPAPTPTLVPAPVPVGPVPGHVSVQDLGEVPRSVDKQFAEPAADLEKRGSVSDNEGVLSGSLRGEVNPVESSFEAEKRNQAVFAASSAPETQSAPQSGPGVVSQSGSGNEPVTQ